MKKVITSLLPAGIRSFMPLVASVAFSSTIFITGCNKTMVGGEDNRQGISRSDVMAATSSPSLMVTQTITDAPRSITHLRKKLGICVNTFDLGNDTWGKQDACIKALKYLKPWMIRTWIRKGNNEQKNYINLIASNIPGQQFCGVLDRPKYINNNNILVVNDPHDVVQWVDEQYPNKVWTMFEGPNEYNLKHPDIDNNNWPTVLLTYQAGLWDNLHHSANYDKTPLLAPSLGKRQGYGDLGSLVTPPDIFCDFGNAHSYWSAVPPGSTSPSDRIDTDLGNLAIVSGDKTVHVTECGWHNAEEADDEGQGNNPAASAQQLLPYLAEYDLRNDKETEKYGWMSLFSLVDDPEIDGPIAEHHFGLFSSTLDPVKGFVPKEHGIAFHNITAILDKDRGTAAHDWGSCKIDIVGPADVKYRYYYMGETKRRMLVVWRRNVKIYNSETDQMLNDPDRQDITIKFSMNRAVKVFYPHQYEVALLKDIYSSTKEVTINLGGEAAMILMEAP